MANTQDLAGYVSLGSDVNKEKLSDRKENFQGVASEKLPELELSMSSEELIKLTEKWEKKWKESPVKAEWEKQGNENEKT